VCFHPQEGIAERSADDIAGEPGEVELREQLEDRLRDRARDPRVVVRARSVGRNATALRAAVSSRASFRCFRPGQFRPRKRYVRQASLRSSARYGVNSE
jgi:hypothetical protein